MERSRIAIVIPALNEALTIGAVVGRAAAWGHVIVVDDGSSDRTAEQARLAGATVVTFATNQGYDGALNAGFACASRLDCQYVITCDADGQHDMSQIGEFVESLEAGNDLVVGMRDRQARIGERVFAAVARRLWGIADPLCGMKGYRIELYRHHDRFDSIRSIGTELAVRSAARGVKVAQHPTVVRDRLDQPRFANPFAANFRILRALAILLSLSMTRRLAK